MLQKKIVEIENISVDELVATLTEKVLEGLESRLEQLQQQKDKELLLTRTETDEYLKIDSSTLWSWTEKGRVKTYGKSRYERKISSNDKFFFNLKATNGQVIGSSKMYASEQGRENGIESVKTNTSIATLEDLF